MTPADEINLAAEIGDLLARGEAATLATIILGDETITPRLKVGAKVLIGERGERFGSTGVPSLDAAIKDYAPRFTAGRNEAATLKIAEFAPPLGPWLEVAANARVLFERIETEPRVVVCGAGHVGASLARLARLVGYRVTLIDDRVDFLAPERFPEANLELVAAADWSDDVRREIGTGRNVSVAIVTRGHREDEECLRGVLAARPAYVGLIGSRRRTNIVLERLRADGVAEEVLREVRAPIGLDIGAVTPEEVALAILGEIVAARRGGAGNSLSAWRRK